MEVARASQQRSPQPHELATGGQIGHLDAHCAHIVCSHLGSLDLRQLREVSREWKQRASHCVLTIAPKLHPEPWRRHAAAVAGTAGGYGGRPEACDEATYSHLPHERFPCVKSLDLKGQCVSSRQLADTALFPMLETLSLEGCKQLKDATLGYLLDTNLKELSLRGCSKLTWAGLGQLKAISTLRTLNCSGVKYLQEHACDATLPKLLGALTSLTLGDTCTLSFVDDSLLKLVGQHASQITHLDCSGCIDISDQGVECLSQISSLESLSLQSCVRLTDRSVKSVSDNLTKLIHLNLRGCLQISDSGVAQLSTCSSLQELSLKGCSAIEGVGFKHLAQLTQLHRINLCQCTNLSTVEHLQSLTQLTDLDLSHCGRLDMLSLSHLSKLEGLSRLNMSHCKNGNTTSTQDLDAHLSNLSTLRGLEDLSVAHFKSKQGLPRGLALAISHMTNLKRLDLSGESCMPRPSWGPLLTTGINHKAEEEGCLWFVSGLTRLQHLNLAGWRQAAPTDLKALQSLTNLSHLNLSRFSNDLYVDASACALHGECSAASSCSRHAIAPSITSRSSISSRSSITTSTLSLELADPNQVEELRIAGSEASGRESGQRVAYTWLPTLALLERQMSGITMDPRSGMEKLVMPAQGGSDGVAGGGSDGVADSYSDKDGKVMATQQMRQPGQTTQAKRGRKGEVMMMRNACDEEVRMVADSYDEGSSEEVQECEHHAFQDACAGPTLWEASQMLLSHEHDLASSSQSLFHGLAVPSTQQNPGSECSLQRQQQQQASVNNDKLDSSGAPQLQHVQHHPHHVHPLKQQQQQLGQPSISSSSGWFSDTEMAFHQDMAQGICQSSPSLDDMLEHVGALTQLQHIDLEACLGLTDTGILHLASLPALTSVNLGGCRNVCGTISLPVLAARCPRLSSLHLDDCPLITDDAIVGLAVNAKQLSKLSLNACTLVGDVGLEAVLHLQKLSNLSLGGLLEVSSRALVAVAQLRNLRSLALPCCPRVCDHAVHALMASPNLMKLNVSHCWRVSAKALRELQAYRPVVKIISNHASICSE